MFSGSEYFLVLFLVPLVMWALEGLIGTPACISFLIVVNVSVSCTCRETICGGALFLLSTPALSPPSLY